MAVEYFTKCIEAILTRLNHDETDILFLSNHVIAKFCFPKYIVKNHGRHFHNHIMQELATTLGFHHEHSMPYYPQANGQVEVVNQNLKTMSQQIVGNRKSNWHLMLFSAIWEYKTSMKYSTDFTPFQLFYGVELVLPIQCEINSLQLVVELLPNTSTEE